LALTLKPSRIASVWWWGLHALLGAAVVLVAWSWPARLVAVAAVLRHAVVCGPQPGPALLFLHPDGNCTVPAWGAERVPLDDRTVIGAWWVRLGFGASLGRRDILLFADQVGEVEWRRLCALLERTGRCDSPHGSARPAEPI